MHDTVIRNGHIIDGSGEARYVGDIAIDAMTISAVGKNVGAGKQEVDATGMLITPGFVDIHTHYDGQATWDSQLAPSIYHGVTTVVMGNCGVGFAPVKPDQRDWLISLMEGVEDIPGSILSEGIDWQWETFPQFLDTLEAKKHSIDLAAQLPHAALRTYVMGQRGGDHQEVPTAAEIEQMASIAKEAVEAGAIGFSSSRSVNHKSASGEYTPSLSATDKELWGIAEGLKQANKGVIQLISDFDDHDAEFELIETMAKLSGRPLSFTLNQLPEKADQWKETLSRVDQSNAQGIALKAQVAPRPVGVLLSFQSTYHPFILCPAFQEIAALPLAEKVRRLTTDKNYRQTVLAEWQGHSLFAMDQLWIIEDTPIYEPKPSDSLAALSEKSGGSAVELAMDAMLQNGGTGMLYYPALNFTANNSDVSRDMLVHPHTVPGLGDGGAHVSFILDASFTTYQLTHWGRDRQKGNLISLEYLIKAQCRDTAEAVGLKDRGLLKVGMKADINVIDFDQLALDKPEMIQDLPAGGNRLMQRARGYRQMYVSGELVMQDGEPTGAQPGRLIRGAQGQ